MSHPDSAAELSRRQLFRDVAFPLAFAVTTGAALIPLERGTAHVAEKLTNMPQGSTGLPSFLEQQCEGDPDPNCETNLFLSPGMQMQTGIIIPLIEEAWLRAVPSALADGAGGFGAERSVRAAVIGPAQAGLDRRAEKTRRSVIAGAAGAAVSTLSFAAIHAQSADGSFNTNRLPTPQFVSGLVLWLLQRKWGYPYNAVAHMTHNVLGSWLIRRSIGR